MSGRRGEIGSQPRAEETNLQMAWWRRAGVARIGALGAAGGAQAAMGTGVWGTACAAPGTKALRMKRETGVINRTHCCGTASEEPIEMRDMGATGTWSLEVVGSSRREGRWGEQAARGR